MYQVGDLILYGRTGVCRVEDITEKNGVNIYTLSPLYQSCNIACPLEGSKVFSRYIISKAEAEVLIEQMPAVTAEPYYNRNLNQLREYYRSRLESPSCLDLVSFAKSLYAKKRELEAQKKKFGAVDERFLKEAEGLLFGELAAAMEIERSEVENYIANKLGQA